jgi:hypothetical protein
MRLVGTLCVDKPVPRQTPRHSTSMPAHLRPRGTQRFPVWVSDISTHGCRLQVSTSVACGTMVWLKLEALEAWRATVVWTNKDAIGCEFNLPLHPAVLTRLLG